MLTTFRKLENERIKWKPQPLLNKPYDLPLESGIDSFVARSIALGLVLELPVGEWVNESKKALKKVISETLLEDALVTMGRNVKDEGVHYKAFKYAQEAYPVSVEIQQEAEFIAKAWDKHTDNPLLSATLAECCIFLPSLALLRLYGGESMSTLANDVSRDEYRHVATNRAMLEYSGYPLEKVNPATKKLQQDTLNWLIADFSDPSLGIDLEWLSEQANILLYEGHAPELEEITLNSEYTPPFESSNKYAY
jgi:hypothetical protein